MDFRTKVNFQCQHFMELMRQISFGIARQQTNTLNLDMSYTCGYNCEDKPGIPA